jgi:hypothetical protein
MPERTDRAVGPVHHCYLMGPNPDDDEPAVEWLTDPVIDEQDEDVLRQAYAQMAAEQDAAVRQAIARRREPTWAATDDAQSPGEDTRPG